MYWKGMHHTFHSYVKSCRSCQINKRHSQKYGHVPPKLVITTQWKALCVNLIGPYVGPRMGTDSFCVMSLPICEILAIPARLRTGSPDMRTGIGNDPRMQTFAYGDQISNFPYAHEHIMHTVRD